MNLCKEHESFTKATRQKAVTALDAALEAEKKAIEKIEAAADRQPFPYEKWVVEAAKQTQLGAMVYPSIQRTVSGIGDFLNPPPDRNWRDWTPVKELRGTLPIVQSGLRELGWVGDWVDAPNAAYFDETARRAAP